MKNLFGIFPTKTSVPLSIIFLILLGTLSKLLFLNSVPLFGDEALYCYLGYLFTIKPFGYVFSIATQIWKDSPGLLILNAINFKIFGQSHPIEICRLSSVISSFISVAIFYLFIRLFSAEKRVHLAAIAFLLFNPFNFFFDRTSLMDVPLVAFLLMFLYFSLRFLQRDRLFFLIASLFSFVCMFFTKINSLVIIPVVVWISVRDRELFQLRLRYFLSLAMVSALSLFVTIRYTNIWDTVFYHVGVPLNIFQLVSRFIQNMRIMASWYRQFLTPLIFILVGIGAWHMMKKKHGALVFILPFFLSFYALVSINLFPRYLLFTLPFLALLVGFSVYTRIARFLFIAMMVAFISSDYYVLMNSNKALLAYETRYEYFFDWGSGIGTQKALMYLSSLNEEKIVLLVPTDLLGLFEILKMEHTPKTPIQFEFFSDTTVLENLLRKKREEKIYIVSTPYHEWITKILTDFPAIILHTTDGFDRNSIILYELSLP